MSEFQVRKAARALAPGECFYFAEEHGGEGQLVTVKSVRDAFGTVSVEVEEFDHELDYGHNQMVTMAPAVAVVEGVGTPTPLPTMENTRAVDTEEVEVLISLRVPKRRPRNLDDRLVMALATYAADMSYVIEAGIEQNRGTSFNDLKFLQNEVQLAADVVKQIDNGGTWTTFGCTEIEALADVFRAADRHDAAVFIVGEHAEGDEPDDHHYGEGNPNK